MQLSAPFKKLLRLFPSRVAQERNDTIGELLLGRVHGDGTTVGTSGIKGGFPAHY